MCVRRDTVQDVAMPALVYGQQVAYLDELLEPEQLMPVGKGVIKQIGAPGQQWTSKKPHSPNETEGLEG